MGAAYDCDTVINPMAVEGQLKGSIHMGLGMALSEELRVENGRTMKNPSWGNPNKGISPSERAVPNEEKGRNAVMSLKSWKRYPLACRRSSS